MQNAHEHTDLPEVVTVTIEVPRGTRVKRDAHGHIDYVSPFPSPFNYGRIDGLLGGDGEPRDVVVLGPRLDRGARAEQRVWGEVRFVDGGEEDDKWVCGPRAPTARDLATVRRFFTVYAALKRVRDRLRRRPPGSAFMGWFPRTHT